MNADYYEKRFDVMAQEILALRKQSEAQLSAVRDNQVAIRDNQIVIRALMREFVRRFPQDEEE